MDNLFKLLAILAIPVIGFFGLLAILPHAWTHDEAGDLSGLGFWLIALVLYGLYAIIKHVVESDRTPL
jgi:ABC-type proline/glycine betaine transport system permease subunit